uniref:Cyclic nucleotide-gated channel beta subunit n=1 Tax=Solanum tuberosum TaxID=4113 RepID=M1E0Q0_SOLTU
MTTLKSYTDEVNDTNIDALKANLKGVTVLTSKIENEEDELLGENNSNQPCENSVLSGQKNKGDNLCERVASLEQSMMEVVAFIRDEKLRRTQKNKKNKAIDGDYTTPTVDEDGASIDIDEILPLKIVDGDLVAVDGNFAEEVNEQEEEKMKEKEEEKKETREEKEEKQEEKKQEENKEEEIEEKKKKRRSRKRM